MVIAQAQGIGGAVEEMQELLAMRVKAVQSTLARADP